MKQSGFLEPKFDERDYRADALGAAPQLKGEPLASDGQWWEFLPEEEKQVVPNFDTFSCVSFGTSNCIEILFAKVFLLSKNFSDRFIAIISDTQPEGNDPKKVIDSIRKQGLVKEESLPLLDSLKSQAEYLQPNPPTPELTAEGKAFLAEHGIGYAWVGNDIESIKNALRYSPLGVSVPAWFDNNGRYYFPEGVAPNHWTALVGYKEGEYWIVFDSYAPHLKQIAWDSKFKYIMRYWLGAGQKEQISILQKIVALYKKILALLGL